jgi:hypothetical protein
MGVHRTPVGINNICKISFFLPYVHPSKKKSVWAPPRHPGARYSSFTTAKHSRDILDFPPQTTNNQLNKLVAARTTALPQLMVTYLKVTF